MPRLDDILDPIAKGLTAPPPEPAPEPDPKIILAHIAQISQNARATWFGLLGLLAFIGVTLLGHNDADFFAYGAETQLPLIGITVPVKAFFTVAPVLVAALYAYLHLYLMTLWDGLADAPARIDGQPLADRVFPWLISYAALWERNRRRKDGCAAPRALGRLVVFVSLLLGWLFGIAVMLGLWLRSMPAHEEWLTLWIGFWLWFAALIGLTGFASAAKRMAGASRAQVARAHGVRRSWGAALAVALAFLSWETTEGGLIPHATGTPPPLLYRADLILAELTRKPPGWLPWHLWMEDFEEKFRRREGIAPGPDLTGEQETAFKKEATERYAEYISQLDAPDLRRADLRSAKMSSTFLPGANLRNAAMQGANLRNAKMQGGNLFRAKMQGATFLRAKMQGADLREVEMQGANLRSAAMQGAQLGWKWKKGDKLDGTRMQGDKRAGTRMQGADLREAQMQDADCNSAIFRGALLHSANVTCRNLTKAQLKDAVGNVETVLPRGLTVASCLETLPEDVEAALVHRPEKGNRFRVSRAAVRDALLCDKGETPHATGTHAPEPEPN
ncbi:MAG: pentapeptide repeat-containing protein [Limibaculum sp.]